MTGKKCIVWSLQDNERSEMNCFSYIQVFKSDNQCRIQQLTSWQLLIYAVNFSHYFMLLFRFQNVRRNHCHYLLQNSTWSSLLKNNMHTCIHVTLPWVCLHLSEPYCSARCLRGPPGWSCLWYCARAPRPPPTQSAKCHTQKWSLCVTDTN